MECRWNDFIAVVQETGRDVFGVLSHKKRCVPGWNDYVRDFYYTSREAFKLWKSNGCPRFGPVACHMRRSRADFKYALRQCRKYEQDIRPITLSRKLQNNEVVPFWKDIQTVRGAVHVALPGRIDSAVGETAIASF